MSEPVPLFESSKHAKPHVGIFMSGSGTNAEHVLEYLNGLPEMPVEVKALVTDAPETSRAIELGKHFSIPVIASDIRKYYHDRGESRVSIATPRGQEIRQEWTDGLREMMRPCELDFAIFAGFVPLTNLTSDFPCLNVHPGDLTYTVDGRRLLVGLHTVPIERAILAGLSYMRSSVIIAQTYTGRGGEMDSGPILGISGEVPLNLQGFSTEHLLENQQHRPALRPKGGYDDDLEHIAQANQEQLKIHGDWVVLPKVVTDYAAGRYALDDANNLYYRIGSSWRPIETVVYHEDGRKEPIFH